MSEDLQTPLRFGIMCKGATLQAFQAAIVRRLVERNVGVPVVLIVDDREAEPEPVSRAKRLIGRLTGPNLLWRLYAAASEPAMQTRVALDPQLDKLPRALCRPVTRGRFSEYFSQAEIEQIASHRLDFILRFGFGIIRGDVLRTARYGVWSFHHGDESRYRGGPPGFWEIYERTDVSGAVLQRLTDRLDAGVILRRGWIKTIKYSYSRNLNALLNETIDWPAAVASEILHGRLTHELPESTTSAPVYKRPTNAQMLRYAYRLGKNIVRHLATREMREEWNVGVTRLTPSDAVRGGVVSDVQWFPRISGGWVADPIAVGCDGKTEILCERMRLDTDQGYIASVSYQGGAWSAERVAIQTGCHASYPYIVQDGGQIYCVPETYQANEVRIYRATSFPHSWELAGTLLSNVSVVDSTIFRRGDLWWLFCTSSEASGHRLHAYYAQRLFGPWRPHAGNPVKTDVRSSRPAGPPFEHDGVLYRPAQDCSKTYGGRIAVVALRDLSPFTFREEIVSYLEPDPRSVYGRGLHTLAFADGVAVIDGKRWRMKQDRR